MLIFRGIVENWHLRFSFLEMFWCSRGYKLVRYNYGEKKMSWYEWLTVDQCLTERQLLHPVYYFPSYHCVIIILVSCCNWCIFMYMYIYIHLDFSNPWNPLDHRSSFILLDVFLLDILSQFTISLCSDSDEFPPRNQLWLMFTCSFTFEPCSTAPVAWWLAWGFYYPYNDPIGESLSTNRYNAMTDGSWTLLVYSFNPE